MPIFIKVESKSLSGRLFHGFIFVFLTLGGLTMIYPFLIMVSGSFRSAMDETDLDLIPAYFYQQPALYQKFLEFKYNQQMPQFNRAHLRRDFGFQFVQAPSQADAAQVATLTAFIDDGLPMHWQRLGGMSVGGTVQENQRALRLRLAATLESPEVFSRTVGTAVNSWNEVTYHPPDWLSNRADFDDNILYQTYEQLLLQAPAAQRQLESLSGYFLEMIAYPQYPDFESFRVDLNLDIDNYHAFRLPAQVPTADQPVFRAHWVDFVLGDLNASFILADANLAQDYQVFLSDFYAGSIEQLNRVWETDHTDFAQIPLPAGQYLPGGMRRDYLAFLETLEPELLRLIGPEYRWRQWLLDRHGSLAAINADLGTAYTDLQEIWLPLADLEYTYSLENSGALRRAFATRNFINVIDAVFIEGRVFLNTVIFCSLSVLFAVLINPLAAYALSRFRLPGSYKILLLMMAVMAFPPMVTTIPVFIMMQNLGLMNTFAALLLPTIANGYLIFLLKGFFDSLPPELYEAAQIEGAGELWMFWSVTMALSKPILAVVALSAFNGAYTVFLYALIVAPDPDMWLLSVWLYQYRETVSMGGVFASVLLASIPPIVVFLFAQNIILRGIVVPVEK